MSKEEEQAIESVHTAMLLSPYDWSGSERLAWIYGIVVGWTDKHLADIAAMYEWGPEKLEELKRHRAAQNLKSDTEKRPPLTRELTGLIRDADWEKIRSGFSEAEKIVLRAAITGKGICPKGVVIDPDQLPRPLYQKLKGALQNL